MKRLAAAALLAAWAASSCVFSLGELVEPGAGGAGDAGGAGGATTASGTGGALPQYEIAIDLESLPSDTLTDFPVLVRLDSGRIDYGLTADDGGDLRFFTTEGSPLAHEIEHWDERGSSYVWVKLPQITPSAASFVMRFGDPGAPAAPPPEEVWSAYHAVYHFAEGAAADSTGGFDGTTSSTAPTIGPLGPALAFNGSSSRVDVPSGSAFGVEPGGTLSYSVMFRRNSTMALAMAVGRTMVGCCHGWRLSVLPDQYANMRFDTGLDDVTGCCSGTSENVGPLALSGEGQADQTWHHFLISIDRAAGVVIMYRDGSELVRTEPYPTTGPMNAGPFNIGNDEYDSNWFLGDIDEARIASAALSADWARLEHLSHTDSLLSFGQAVPIAP